MNCRLFANKCKPNIDFSCSFNLNTQHNIFPKLLPKIAHSAESLVALKCSFVFFKLFVFVLVEKYYFSQTLVSHYGTDRFIVHCTLSLTYQY